MTTATPTLSIDRVAQAQISSTVTTLLSTSATARRANIPLNNVVAAGFSQQAALITEVVTAQYGNLAITHNFAPHSPLAQ